MADAEVEVESADDLFLIDPAAFVAERNALVKRLKAAGDKAAAAEVQAMRKPSPPAWALNQVARSSPDLVTAALDAGAELRAATDAAVAGDASTLRAATAADRAATDAVVDAAAKRLGSKGAAAKQALAATVRAAVLDDAVAADLRAGTLVAEHDASGFGFGLGADAGGEVIPFRPRPAKRAAEDDAEPPAGEDGKTKAERKAREKAEREAAAKAEREAAAAAEEEERERRRRRAEVEEEVRKAERRAARLAEVAERAERAAAEAREDADEAAAAVESARSELAELE